MKEFIEVPATKSSLLSRKLICGVGKNDASYLVSYTSSGVRITCPYYETWRKVIDRCYSEKTKSRFPTYKNCTVCNEWLLFSRFKRWMKGQDWVGKQLDKDILFVGNKHYSPSTCVFVSGRLNSAILKPKPSKSGLPAGVYRSKKSGRYHARCHADGVLNNLGSFSTPHDAAMCYARFKSDYLYSLAFEEEALLDHRIHRGLIEHAKLFKGMQPETPDSVPGFRFNHTDNS
jgi:hypothetical protein